MSQGNKVAEGGTFGLQDVTLVDNIIANIPYFVFWKDINSVYLGCNHAFSHVAGLGDPKDIVGKTDFQLAWSEDEAEFYRSIDRRVMDSGNAELDIIETQTQFDGKQRWLRTSKVPLRDSNGVVAGILGIYVDVTESYHREEELQLARDVAEKASTAKSDFLAVMSHELRTPLTLILGPSKHALTALKQPIADVSKELPWVVKLLESTIRNASRLKVLTDDILNYSKFEAGEMKLHVESIDIKSHLIQLIDDLQPAALAKSLRLIHRLDISSALIDIDIEKLDHVLLNLLGNALKFAPKDSEIELDVTEKDSRLIITVSDQGVGIEPAERESIFDKFRQSSTSKEELAAGTGLGLALCRQLTELMGGSVSAHQSPHGKGAMFLVDVPFSLALNSTTKDSDRTSLNTSRDERIESFHRYDSPLAQGKKRELARDATRLKLVLAEDNSELRAYISSILRVNYEVLEAGDGEEALQLLLKHNSKLLVTDWMMPNCDGPSLIRAVRKDTKLQGVKIIMLTARGGEDAVEESLAVGADDYIAKPFSERELLARVSVAERLTRMSEELIEIRSREEESQRLASLGRLLAKLSHEINNPTNVIYNSIEPIREYADVMVTLLRKIESAHPELWDELKELREHSELEYASSDIFSALSTLRIAAQRIRGIQTQLRVFLRGRSRYQPMDADIFASIDEAVQLSKRAVPKVSIEVQGDSPLLLRHDPLQLGQILQNLINNACQSQGGKGCITIAVSVELSEVRIRVIDQGTGISELNLSRIFEPFFTTKEIGSGTGLGLSVSRELAIMAGGSLEVESTSLKGTCFSLILPR